MCAGPQCVRVGSYARVHGCMNERTHEYMCPCSHVPMCPRVLVSTDMRLRVLVLVRQCVHAPTYPCVRTSMRPCITCPRVHASMRQCVHASMCARVHVSCIHGCMCRAPYSHACNSCMPTCLRATHTLCSKVTSCCGTGWSPLFFCFSKCSRSCHAPTSIELDTNFDRSSLGHEGRPTLPSGQHYLVANTTSSQASTQSPIEASPG